MTTLHSSLTGSELHFPLGHSSAGTLTLSDNDSSAYLIENTGGNDYFKISTANAAENIRFGNATDNPYAIFLGTGGVGIGTSAAPTALLHVQRNNTGVTGQILVDQDGSGDAVVQLDCGAQSWTIGVDNSDDDGLTISQSSSLGTSNKIQVKPAGGAIGLATSTASGHWTRRLRVETVEASTADATATSIWTLTLAEGEAVIVDVKAIATSGAETGMWAFTGAARRYTGGAATEVTGSEDVYATGEEDASWDCYLDTSGNDVRVMVTLDGSVACRVVASICYHVITA